MASPEESSDEIIELTDIIKKGSVDDQGADSDEDIDLSFEQELEGLFSEDDDQPGEKSPAQKPADDDSSFEDELDALLSEGEPGGAKPQAAPATSDQPETAEAEDDSGFEDELDALLGEDDEQEPQASAEPEASTREQPADDPAQPGDLDEELAEELDLAMSAATDQDIENQAGPAAEAADDFESELDALLSGDEEEPAAAPADPDLSELEELAGEPESQTAGEASDDLDLSELDGLAEELGGKEEAPDTAAKADAPAEDDVDLTGLDDLLDDVDEPQPAETEAQEPEAADDDLDALLAEVGGAEEPAAEKSEPEEAEPASEAGTDDDLDALLAEAGGTEVTEEAGEEAATAPVEPGAEEATPEEPAEDLFEAAPEEAATEEALPQEPAREEQALEELASEEPAPDEVSPEELAPEELALEEEAEEPGPDEDAEQPEHEEQAEDLPAEEQAGQETEPAEVQDDFDAAVAEMEGLKAEDGELTIEDLDDKAEPDEPEAEEPAALDAGMSLQEAEAVADALLEDIPEQDAFLEDGEEEDDILAGLPEVAENPLEDAVADHADAHLGAGESDLEIPPDLPPDTDLGLDAVVGAPAPAAQASGILDRLEAMERRFSKELSRLQYRLDKAGAPELEEDDLQDLEGVPNLEERLATLEGKVLAREDLEALRATIDYEIMHRVEKVVPAAAAKVIREELDALIKDIAS